MNNDVLVLGGGLIGASIAYTLSKKGLSVRLLEKRSIGSGASGHSAAMLETQIDAYRGEPFLSFAKASRNLFPTLYETIKNETGIDFQYEQCGILQIATDESDAQALQSEIKRQETLGLKAEWRGAGELQKESPFLKSTQHGGAFFKEDGQVHGNRFLETVLDAAKKKGTTVSVGYTDVEWKLSNGKIDGLQADNDFFTAKTYVIASGAWSPKLASPLGLNLPLEPIRGQMLIYSTPDLPLAYPVYTKDRGYITPKRDGTTYVGATVENVGFDESSTDEGKAALEIMAKQLYPDLLKSPLKEVAVGLRPKSFDELPFIGALEDHPNVILAAGHYRNGVLLSPITAQVVSDLVLGQKPRIDLAPFSVTRTFSTHRE